MGSHSLTMDNDTQRDPKTHPRVGDTAVFKRGSKPVSVVKIITHLKSTDIAYVRVQFPNGREKSSVLYEWATDYCDYTRGDR